MSIVWIASYPKSGNTLVRLLLFNYLYGDSDNTDTIDDRIPDLHRCLEDGRPLETGGQDTRFVKTHFLWSERHLYADQTAGLIYIVRNPRDVLLSNFRYLYPGCSADIRFRFASVFIREMGVPRWAKMGMGTWPGHIASWQSAARRFPHVLLRYEDLRLKPEESLAAILGVAGESPDAGRLRAAVAASTIEKSRQHEAREKALGRTRVYSRLPDNANFVGEGRMDQSLEDIGPGIEAQFRARFSQVGRRFGYA